MEDLSLCGKNPIPSSCINEEMHSRCIKQIINTHLAMVSYKSVNLGYLQVCSCFFSPSPPSKTDVAYSFETLVCSYFVRKDGLKIFLSLLCADMEEQLRVV